jgi:hypothetical protein
MIAVMISKWVADAFGPDGIYASWIALRRYPWLAPIEFRDNGEIAADAMTPVNNLIVLQGVSSLGELGQYCVFYWRGDKDHWVDATFLNRKTAGNVGVPWVSSCGEWDAVGLRCA